MPCADQGNVQLRVKSMVVPCACQICDCAFCVFMSLCLTGSGRGAARIRRMFERARAIAPCVLFIDELDAVGKARGGLNSHDEREQTLNQLLTAMDGVDGAPGQAPVLVIAATNRIHVRVCGSWWEPCTRVIVSFAHPSAVPSNAKVDVLVCVFIFWGGDWCLGRGCRC